jgi:hypothetical protein
MATPAMLPAAIPIILPVLMLEAELLEVADGEEEDENVGVTVPAGKLRNVDGVVDTDALELGVGTTYKDSITTWVILKLYNSRQEWFARCWRS